MLRHMICLCVGFGLDSLFGDPHFLWHPVQGIGKLVGWLEKGLFAVLRIRQDKEQNQHMAGNGFGMYHVRSDVSGKISAA